VTPDVVVDVGNTRVKFGKCVGGAVTEVTALLVDETAWAAAVGDRTISWAVAGVHPERIERFVSWVRGRGETVLIVDHHSKVPIFVSLPYPEQVGIDRLLGAVAANARRKPGRPAITIDVGTAITINVIDPGGAFRGGAIYPGFDLMAKALHTHTAKLPLVAVDGSPVPIPGQDTASAIRAGIRSAIVGGVTVACAELAKQCGNTTMLDAFVTGGGSTADLFQLPGWIVQYVPTLNLEGLRIASEAN